MEVRYKNTVSYRCSAAGVCTPSHSRTLVYQDNKPKPVKGDFVTPRPYSRSITIRQPGDLKEYKYTTSGQQYVSLYNNSNIGINTGRQEVVSDTLSDRNLSAAITRSFQQNILNLSMMAKDLYEASNMALDYFKRVSRCWKSLKRRNFRKAFKDFTGSRSLSKGMANNWLAFQYGVLPTIQSVQDAFAAANNQKAQTVRLVTTCSGEKLIRYRSPSQYTNVYGYNRQYKSIRGFRYFTTSKTIRALLVTNQVEVAWDATPYSFLLDWFIPVSDYLTQFGYSTNLIANTGCNSQIQISERRGASSARDMSTGRLMRVQEEVFVKTTTFTRSLSNEIVYRPSFSEVLNQSKIGLTTNRCVNAFALLVQRIR